MLFELELNVLMRRLADMRLEAPARPIIQGINSGRDPIAYSADILWRLKSSAQAS